MDRVGPIPIIDLSPIRGRDEDAKRALAGELDQAFATVGFCYVVNHGVSKAIIDAAFSASASFYALPQETKDKVAVNELFRGYTGANDALTSYRDYNSEENQAQIAGEVKSGGKEFFNLSLEVPELDANREPGEWVYGPNFWPDFMPGFRDAIYPYFEAVCACGNDLLRGVALALGVHENFFLDKYTRNTAQCTVLHYPPLSAEDIAAGVISSVAHCDFSCISLLYQDNIGGLQVQQRSSGQWIDAAPVEGAFVINVGDMLARWTNDRYVSTPHRVMNLSGKGRYSIGTFFNPSADAAVDPRDLGIPSEQCAYAQIQAGKYMQQRFAELYSAENRSE